MHNDYPLALEKLEIKYDMLSKYWSNIADKYDIRIGGVNKLVPNLGNKSKYVLHYKNLQLYLSLGVKLVCVNRILKLKQSDWLMKYIDFNTDKRQNAVYSFEKEFLCWWIIVFIAKQHKIWLKARLVNNAKHYKNYVSTTSFVSQKIFSKIFVTTYEIKY